MDISSNNTKEVCVYMGDIYTGNVCRHGGHIVICKLVHLLVANNVNAYLFCHDVGIQNLVGFDIPTKDNFDWENTIVIYPEIIMGNPLNCKDVCRWMLFYPTKRHPEMLHTWAPTDVLCSYGGFTADLPCKIDISVVDFNEKRLKITNSGDRPRKFYLLHKVNNYDWTATELYNHIQLLKQNGFEEMVNEIRFDIDLLYDLLNQCSIFVSYDLNTFVSNAAVMCGSVSMIAKSENHHKSYENVLENRGCYGSTGILPFTMETLNAPYDFEKACKLREEYMEYANTTNNVSKFIEYFKL